VKLSGAHLTLWSLVERLQLLGIRVLTSLLGVRCSELLGCGSLPWSSSPGPFGRVEPEEFGSLGLIGVWRRANSDVLAVWRIGPEELDPSP
jgi:hypothetical protein